MLLYSVEFVLVKENLKAQGTCTIFRTTPNLPHLLRSVLEFWECGFVKYCFVLWNLYCLKRLENTRQSKNLNLCLSLLAYTMCVCVIFFELVELVGYSQKNCYGSFHHH